MSDVESGIEYVDHFYGPWRGCTKTESPGCAHCYTEREMEGRFKMDFHTVTIASRSSFRKPRSKKRVPPGSRVFVCPWGDFFHEDVDPEARVDALEIIGLRPDVTFIIPTKRPEMIDEVLFGGSHHHYLGGGDYIPNIILLLSVATQGDLKRWGTTFFNSASGFRHGLSVEPMLGPVDIKDYCWHFMVSWVICGGESGPEARPMHPDWARALRAQCWAAGVPFFFKQWGEWGPDYPGEKWNGLAALVDREGTDVSVSDDHIVTRELDGNEWCAAMYRVGKKAAGHLLDGVEYHEYPEGV